MKKLIILIFILLIQVDSVLAFYYSDVIESHPNYIAIEAMTKAGIFGGYSDGTFKPDQRVNRAEALKIVLSTVGKTPKTGLYSTGFIDVPIDEWYAGYVMNGITSGIVSGNPDGTFAGNRDVNTAEFLKMTLLSFNIDLSKHNSLSSKISEDVKSNEWYSPYLSYAKTIGLIYPDEEHKLFPEKQLTRGECANIVYKMLLIQQGGETQKLLSIVEARLLEAIIMQNLKNIKEAVDLVDEAVFYASLAKDRSPNSTAVQSVSKISEGFQNLIYAFSLVTSSKGTKEEILNMIEKAEILASEAESINETSSVFAKHIKKNSDLLKKAI